jgi:predicted ATPase/DNA-binding winged helix-turn-helix (wHTH) protein
MPPSINGRAISFGPFLLLAEERLLLEGDRPVRLGSRAFDILVFLIERAGSVVGKEELITRVWPQTFVDDANLKIQISALRRALGDGQGGNRYIVTIVGRGYNFVAPIRREEPSRTRPPATHPTAKHNLPLAVTRIIGREQAVETLISRLSRQRLVTVTGPGGIGKTTVTLTVAERVVDEYEHGVWLVDLASLGDAHLVPSAVGTVLGLQIHGGDLIHGLVTALRDTRMLLLLDNCEHLIDAVANLARALLSGAKDVIILATSREPLRVKGESEYRLGPLGSPHGSSKLTAAEAATFPVVQLFVERVTAVVEDFELTDENAPLMVEVCRGLDGLPLAIEFAAPGVQVLGLEGLVARLKDSLPLLGSRRRARVARHRTMRAVIDWSYDSLNQGEQIFFRALGIFSGGFTVEAAAAVAMDTATVGIVAIDRLADLVAKSLVVAEVSGAKPRFRLLETIRAYAIETLDESGEHQAIARRHADYYRSLFERAENESTARLADDWLADYACEIDNVRAALDWSFSSGGDGATAGALAAAAAPLWMRLSLLEECRKRVQQALGGLGAGGVRNSNLEMRLQAALGASTSEASELGAAFTKALDIAEGLGQTEYQLRALRGLYSYHNASGRYRAALPFAQRFYALTAAGSAAKDRLFGERMVGVARHFLGDQSTARRHLELVLTGFAADDRGSDYIRAQIDSHIIRFHTDLHVSARMYLARVLWLQGLPDQAVRTAKLSIEEARATGHALSLCTALALAACPIALWTGDPAMAANYARELLEHSRRHFLPLWNAYGAVFHRIVAIRSGDPDGDLPMPHAALSELAGPNVTFRFLTGLIELAEALTHAGRIADGLAVVEAGMEQSEVGWLTPELLRLKGELLLLQGTPAAVETIENLFRQALDEARRQEALSWQLRAATSLARLLRDQGRWDEAIACLRPIYDRFTEGFGTADLVAAKQLLDEADDPGTSGENVLL